MDSCGLFGSDGSPLLVVSLVVVPSLSTLLRVAGPVRPGDHRPRETWFALGGCWWWVLLGELDVILGKSSQSHLLVFGPRPAVEHWTIERLSHVGRHWRLMFDGLIRHGWCNERLGGDVSVLVGSLAIGSVDYSTVDNGLLVGDVIEGGKVRKGTGDVWI